MFVEVVRPGWCSPEKDCGSHQDLTINFHKHVIYTNTGMLLGYRDVMTYQ